MSLCCPLLQLELRWTWPRRIIGIFQNISDHQQSTSTVALMILIFFFLIFQKLCWHIFQKLRTYMCILDFIYNYASLWSIKLGIQLWLPYYIINPLSNMLILPSGSISGKRWAYILPGWVSTHRCLSLHPSLESSCSFMVVPLLMITYQGNSQSEGSWQCLNLSQGWVPHIYWKVIFPPIFI